MCKSIEKQFGIWYTKLLPVLFSRGESRPRGGRKGTLALSVTFNVFYKEDVLFVKFNLIIKMYHHTCLYQIVLYEK